MKKEKNLKYSEDFSTNFKKGDIIADYRDAIIFLIENGDADTVELYENYIHETEQYEADQYIENYEATAEEINIYHDKNYSCNCREESARAIKKRGMLKKC